MEKGCRNTFEKLAVKSLFRVFYSFILLVNNDTTHIVNLDLDVIHEKKKEFKEVYKSYVVKSIVRYDAEKAGKKSFHNYVGMPINRFTFNKLIKYFIITKTEDQSYIIIYLNSKRSFNDSIMNWKVLISKKDLCLHEISMETTIPYINKEKKNVTEKNKYFQFVRYNCINGKYYLDEVINSHSFQSISNKNSIFVLTHYKVYQEGGNFVERRKSIIIPKNYFFSNHYRN